jgi:CDP-glycerol glycerophosphotransferase (TagB/SpsB family)
MFPFYKNKRIWTVMDRIDMADDNAEHFYRYASRIDDGIDKYFTISKDSRDFSRLSEEFKNVIPYYSIKQRILFIFSEKIVSSQADDQNLNPFFGKHNQLYSGIANADIMFLQHGVIKDDMSNWLRKYDKNVQLLVTTADIEAESFKKYDYHYRDGVVQVLGLPRYDNLENNSKNKQILIMPSWRRNLIHLDNDQIAKSQYFQRFNSLINNERLIELAKSKGYKIIFKPHPNTFRFIELFDENNYVIIDNESKYQDLFNNSSLMITDYSSLAFDFAYIKKPLMYYQYGNDYHFGDNFFDYETMGFGEVIKEEDELIDTIEEYLNNDCEMKDVYLERSNKFYKYNDKNNCKRVYDAIMKIK